MIAFSAIFNVLHVKNVQILHHIKVYIELHGSSKTTIAGIILLCHKILSFYNGYNSNGTVDSLNCDKKCLSCN